MIAHVSGIVAEKFNSSVIVDVHGVGYEVAVALGDYEHALLNEPVKFYTYHHIREHACSKETLRNADNGTGCRAKSGTVNFESW
jgi:Holliday junction resolvasome RuvABC DNA-binding subunit